MYVKHRLIKIFFLFVCFVCFQINIAEAQEQVIVYGTVLDTLGLPVEGATITIPENNNGTYSNSEGRFSIKVHKKPFTIVVTHLAYVSQRKYLTINDILKSHRDSVQVNFRLIDNNRNLPAVEISAAYTPYGNSKLHILQYDFYKDHTVLLVKEGRKHQLHLLSGDNLVGDKLLLTVKPAGLMKDCIGNLYLMTEDSMYRIGIKNENLVIHDVFPVSVYHNYLEPCTALSPSHFFHKIPGWCRQMVNYYSIERETGESRLMKSVTDYEALGFSQYFGAKIASSNAPSIMADLWIADLILVLEKMDNIYFRETVLEKPVNAPMLGIRDSVYLFNHVSDSVFVFAGNGELISRRRISYHLDDDWTGLILKDEDASGLFALYRKNGVCSLAEIDLNNGVPGKRYVIRHSFPEQVKVNGNQVYYLWHDHGEAVFLHREYMK